MGSPNNVSDTGPIINAQILNQAGGKQALQFKNATDQRLSGLSPKILGTVNVKGGEPAPKLGFYERHIQGAVLLKIKGKEGDTYVKVNARTIKQQFNLSSKDLKGPDVTAAVAKRLNLEEVIKNPKAIIESESLKTKAEYDEAFKSLKYAYKIAPKEAEKKQITDLLQKLSDKYLKLPEGNRDRLNMAWQCYNLMSQEGRRVDVNLCKAIADAGYTKAQAAMGRYYLKHDINQSKYYLEKAAANGDVSALQSLASLAEPREIKKAQLLKETMSSIPEEKQNAWNEYVEIVRAEIKEGKTIDPTTKNALSTMRSDPRVTITRAMQDVIKTVLPPPK